MDNCLIILLMLSIFVKALPAQADLQEPISNQDHLDPLNDPEYTNTSSKDQDKRTIFNPTIHNYAWAKHVAVRPFGKQLLGYGPVDLKYTPVLRPIAIKHHGYHYNKPKIHLHLKRPVQILHTGWKPVISVTKPVVPIIKPALPVNVPPLHAIVSRPLLKPAHIDHIHTGDHVNHLHLNPVPHVDHIHTGDHVNHLHLNPVPHVDHIHTGDHVNPLHLNPVPHVDHIHKEPVTHIDPVPVNHIHQIPQHIHQVPVQPAPIHIDHIHQHVVPHQDHLHAVSHIDHIHTVPQAVQHIHPVPIHSVQVQPAAVPIAANYFEVTKPDLGVLPLGSVFSSPVLKEIPAPQFKPAFFPQPVNPIHPVSVAPAHPFIHLHAAPQVPVNHVNPVTHLQPVPQIPIPQVPVQPVQSAAPVFPQPHQFYPHGTVVEYHGSTNIVNLLKGQVPVLPQPVVNQGLPPVSMLPNHFHLHYPQIPQNIQPHEQHDVQTPTIPGHHGNIFPSQQQLPIDNQAHFQAHGQNIVYQNLPHQQPHFQDAGQNVFEQNLPHHQSHFQDAGRNIFEQNLPHQQPHLQDPGQNVIEQNLPHQEPHSQGTGQNVFEQNTPHQQSHFQQDQDDIHKYQPADQVSTQHFFRGDQGHFQSSVQSDHEGYAYQRPSQSIQPGQTDVQLPLHLPHHPGFESTQRQLKEDNFHDDRFTDTIFKPSIQLEPPYKR